MNVNRNRLRQLPSVDQLLGVHAVRQLIDAFGRQQAVDALRQALDAVRSDVIEGSDVPETPSIVTRAAALLEQQLAPTLRPVINATGVIIHTNLGRAPLSRAAREAMDAVAKGYSTLEYDLDTGTRGHRIVHAERLLCRLTGAEAALVVNNNAGAVLLALTGMARGQGVIISRGQLVEIGGGFRVPDVMAQSGARLIEVGTTNRTHLYDYENALRTEDDAALILRAHHSNFRIVGFTSEPPVSQLVELGERHALPVMDDLGSGALLDTAEFGLGHEPTVQESVSAGAGVVCFSGDKLLGGPQAGIIVGKEAHVEPLKSHPLTRAFRPGKLCLAGLQETLLHYARDEAVEQIPVWHTIATPVDAIAQRAGRWRKMLGEAGVASEIVDGCSAVGGGSLPGETLPTRLVALPMEHPDRLASALRDVNPPVIGRIENGRLVLDPRTVQVNEDQALLENVAAAAGSLR